MKAVTKSAKERIVEKAQELFYTQGFQNTGINQIIEESGTAKASFYQYFKSKDDLAISYLRYYEDRVVNVIERLMNKYPAPSDFFSIWTKIMYRDVCNNQNYNGDPFANFSSQLGMADKGSISEEIHLIISRMHDLFKAYFKKLIKENKINAKNNANTLARRILLIYQGAMSMSKIENDLNYVEDLEELFLSLIH